MYRMEQKGQWQKQNRFHEKTLTYILLPFLNVSWLYVFCISVKNLVGKYSDAEPGEYTRICFHLNLLFVFISFHNPFLVDA